MKEKLSRLALSFALAIALYAAFLPTASADDVAESLHVAVDGTGAYLFSISGEISEGDEYISADNILYRIATVQNGNAIAEKIGEEAMPDVSWLDVGQAQPVFAQESTVPAASAKADVATPPRNALCKAARPSVPLTVSPPNSCCMAPARSARLARSNNASSAVRS